MEERETSEDVRNWFLQEVSRLWPASGGSLSLRKNRCIRPNCGMCRSGEGHPTYALHTRERGRQRSIYVPDDLADQMAQAVENGRRLKALLVAAGRRYLKALKRERESR